MARYVEGQRVWVLPHSTSITTGDGEEIPGGYELRKTTSGKVTRVMDRYQFCSVSFKLDGRLVDEPVHYGSLRSRD